MNKLRVSYSLLNAWKKGKIEEAVNLYLHKQKDTTPQQQYGLDFEDKVCKRAEDTTILTVGKTNFQLFKPEFQKELTVSYSDLVDIKGRFDIFDKKVLYELKTGIKTSAEYSNEKQVPLYFFICKLAQIPVNQAFILRYDQYNNKDDFTLIWNNDEICNRGKNFVDSLVPDIYDYFASKGILNQKNT
jgi:hypothetical protein